ncbi:MAG: TolC family protein [Prosthecobacter sp.]|nr:TolC family protein [Prosthecobacter sp.]
MPFKAFILAIVALFGGMLSLKGAVTLDDIAVRVSAKNPDLIAARFMIAEAKGRHLGSGRLMNPEIEVSGRHMTQGREGGFSVGLMQKFPVTARLRIEKTVTAAQIAAAEAEVDDKRRMLIAEAESMAVRILAMQAEIGIAEGQATLAEKLTEIATARAAANESAIDAGQMRLEARQQRNSIRKRQAEIAAMNELLKPMLGLSANDELAVTGALPEATAASRVQSNDVRPDIQAALHRVDAAAQSVNLAKARKWEDVSAGVMVDRSRTMDEPMGLENETMIGVRISIPLPFWNRNQGEIAETTAMRSRALAEVQALRLKAAGEVSSAKKEMDRLRPFLTENNTQLLPLARQQIERVREAYANNKASLQDLLRARDQLLMVEMDTVNALRDYNLAKVRWSAALGRNIR